MFLCIRPSVSKLKNHIVFFIQKKKQCFSMHFGFDNQFIRVKRTLVKVSKTIKILFCLSYSIRGTILHVIHIPDIKCFSNDSVAPDIAAAHKINLDYGKRTDIWHLVLLGESLRSRHLVLWSLGTLTGHQRFYGSGLVT